MVLAASRQSAFACLQKFVAQNSNVLVLKRCYFLCLFGTLGSAFAFATLAFAFAFATLSFAFAFTAFAFAFTVVAPASVVVDCGKALRFVVIVIGNVLLVTTVLKLVVVTTILLIIVVDVVVIAITTLVPFAFLVASSFLGTGTVLVSSGTGTVLVSRTGTALVIAC
jgi:hypothetical protein